MPSVFPLPYLSDVRKPSGATAGRPMTRSLDGLKMRSGRTVTRIVSPHRDWNRKSPSPSSHSPSLSSPQGLAVETEETLLINTIAEREAELNASLQALEQARAAVDAASSAYIDAVQSVYGPLDLSLTPASPETSGNDAGVSLSFEGEMDLDLDASTTLTPEESGTVADCVRQVTEMFLTDGRESASALAVRLMTYSALPQSPDEPEQCDYTRVMNICKNDMRIFLGLMISLCTPAETV